MNPTRTRLRVEDIDPKPEWVAAVRARLDAGEVVVLPTETVYGLAARADQAAPLAELSRLKGRAPEQPFTWHVGERAVLERFKPRLPQAERLAERYWPGPLTLLLPGAPKELRHLTDEGWTGVRLPAHKATAGILRALPYPVAMTSANRHGRPPATEAAVIEREFGDELGLILDAGRSRLAEASTILRLGRGRFELVREGLIDLAALRHAAGLRIAFVCTGNTCRSPMAEGLARAVLAERLATQPDRIADFGFVLASLGVAAVHGDPASHHAVSIVADAGVDLSQHRARGVQDVDLERFDLLLCMTQRHLEALKAQSSTTIARRAEMLDPEGQDISDPIGGTRETYRKAAEQIRRAIEARAERWA